MSLIQKLGPGIITACAAIGISHFAQATRAGSYFGYDLLWLILLAHIAKYPFIEFGNRYTSATGESFLVGYWRYSKPVFYLITAITAFVATFTFAAGGFICAGIIKVVLGAPLSVNVITALLLGFCTIIITVGHYKLIDSVMKIFIVLLTFTTFAAVILAAINYTPLPQSEIFYSDYQPFEAKHIPFLIALMGFMPGPIELSVWHSLWLKARNRTVNKLNFKQATFDFNVGYAIMAITAILFLSIGALMVNNSNSEVPNGAAGFAQLLVDSYTSSIGSWAAPIVGISILAAMFSTVLAIVDSYPRVLAQSILIISGEKEEDEELPDKAKKRRILHSSLMALYSIAATLVIIFLFDNFKQILDFASCVAFVVAPIYAFVNYKVVTSKLLPQEFQPGRYIRILSYFGLTFLVGFLAWFVWVKIFII